jgi:hypothetical protein
MNVWRSVLFMKYFSEYMMSVAARQSVISFLMKNVEAENYTS